MVKKKALWDEGRLTVEVLRQYGIQPEPDWDMKGHPVLE